MEHALPRNVTDIPPEARETALASETDSRKESLAPLEAAAEVERDAAIGRLHQVLRTMAQRIDNAERSQSQTASVMRSTAHEINAAALDQAQAFLHLAHRIDRMERHPEPSAIRDEVDRVREALGPHLAAIDRKLEHFGAWLRQAEELSQPDTRLEDMLRSFGTRIDATEQNTSAMLRELKTSLDETARRLEAIEYAMPLGGTPVHPPGPLAAEIAPRSDLPLVLVETASPDDHADAEPVPAIGESPAPKPQSGDMSRYYSGEAKGRRRIAHHAAMAAAVLVLATAGLLMTGNTGDRREAAAPAPSARVAAQPNLDGSAVSSLPQSEPLSGAMVRLTAQAAAGDPKAALALGIKYADGDEVREDDAEAARWLSQAAVAGEAVAQYRFGTLYEKGLGVDLDVRQAMSWYGEAARHGNRKAMHNLALLYADGTGVPKSYTDAARWFRAAAELGVTDSQFNLAVLYERGWGVPASLSEAYKWYAIAAAGGDPESKARIEALASEIPDADRQAAENAAKAYVPRPMDVAAN